MDIDHNSPILILQPELLSLVFSFAVHQPASHHALPVADPTEIYKRFIDVHSLSSVCRTWRDVARSTPSLWGMLCIHVQDRNTHYPPGEPTGRSTLNSGERRIVPTTLFEIYPRMSLVERWLERSAAYPLDLALNVLWGRPGIEEEDRIVEVVRRNRERLRSLRVAWCIQGCAKVMEALTEEDNTTATQPKLKLEVLVLHAPNGMESRYKGATVKIPYSKGLRELTLDIGRVVPIFPVPGRRLGLENLRSLTIEIKSLHVDDNTGDTNRMLDMLEACSETLERFSWKSNSLVFSPSFPRSIRLPSLISLRVKSRRSPTPLFALLTLPSLSSLHIVVYPQCKLPLASHPGLLSRSICPKTGKTKLEDIHVETNLDVPLHEVLEILRISPGLQTFFFTTPLTEELALALVAQADSELPPSSSSPSFESDSYAAPLTLAPHLHHMEFSCSWEGGGDLFRDVDALEKMVRSRWGGPSGLFPGKGALKSVRVYRVHFDDMRFRLSYAALKDCVEEGFRLVLVYF